MDEKAKPEPQVAPYDGPAGGWDALKSVRQVMSREGILNRRGKLMLEVNQSEGFDCPGCAWPDPNHRSNFEFCENGAKAVAWEATDKRVTAEFFAEHSVSALNAQSDHWLEAQGRLTEPLAYDAASDRYLPVSWEHAFAEIGGTLAGLASPHQAEFYTSGRTSNEAAFLFQLFVRRFGTNNFPDCSNMCHEATSKALPMSIGVGKGTVQLADFEHADLILSFGHNPGTNHPRMLSTLRAIVKRGGKILVFNPLRERGLERFRSPQSAVEMLSGGETALATHYYQVKIGGDIALLQGLMKRLLELQDAGSLDALDQPFIAAHTLGFAELTEQLRARNWPELEQESGLSQAQIAEAAELYARAKNTITCYGMGITQHRFGAQNVHQLANLLLMRGNLGRPGAGICPLRGHSNVQGDRTMGINDQPSVALLDSLQKVFGFNPPREPGHATLSCIAALRERTAKVFIALGGNFSQATPEPELVRAALRQTELTVSIITKLNRTALSPGRAGFILPCLGRTERDLQASGEQFVTVEDSMSMVHASRGTNLPASPALKSEVAIVAEIAHATLGEQPIVWRDALNNYDQIRELIARTIPGFQDFNQRVRKPGGFFLGNSASERRWATASGKAHFLVTTHLRADSAEPGALLLTTIRSHDQFNTTIYGNNDRYRGITGTRKVLFANAADLAERGLIDGETVDLIGEQDRRAAGFRLVAYDIPRGCCASYFPEANGVISLASFDPASGTPAYKSVPVRLERLSG